MTRNPANPLRRRGFTLLELLLAMGMVAMLSLSLYSALGAAYKGKRSAEAAVKPARATAIAADLIGRDLESVMPASGNLAGPFVGYHQGTIGSATDALQFHTVGNDNGWDDVPMSEGIRRVELGVRTDVSPPALVRRVTRNLLATVEPEPEEEVLCRGVKSFAVRYYDGYSWFEDWDSTLLDGALPFAVQIEIELDAGENGSQLSSVQQARYRLVRLIPLSTGKPMDVMQALE